MNSASHFSDLSTLSSRVSTPGGRNHTLLGILLAATVLLTGCNDSVLDFRNAEISNGKLYRDGSDKPFTASVTNLPTSKFPPQPGLAPFLRTVGVVLREDNYSNDFILRGALCDVKVKDGVLEGEAVCKLPQSQTLHSRMSFRSGVIDGDYTTYDFTPANHVVANLKFDKGVITGKEELFSPQTQKLVYQVTWQAGVPNGEEQTFDARTGKQIASLHYRNGQIEGVTTRWASDGTTVLYRTTASAGLQDGVEEEFFENGKPRRRTEWNRGKKNGRSQEWDAQGNLTRDTIYNNDVERQPHAAGPVAATESTSNVSTAANPQACAQAKADYQLKADSRQGASLSDGEALEAACAPESKRPS